MQGEGLVTDPLGLGVLALDGPQPAPPAEGDVGAGVPQPIGQGERLGHDHVGLRRPAEVVQPGGRAGTGRRSRAPASSPRRAPPRRGRPARRSGSATTRRCCARRDSRGARRRRRSRRASRSDSAPARVAAVGVHPDVVLEPQRRQQPRAQADVLDVVEALLDHRDRGLVGVAHLAPVPHARGAEAGQRLRHPHVVVARPGQRDRLVERGRACRACHRAAGTRWPARAAARGGAAGRAG